MSTKKMRREVALKRAKTKKMILIAVCSLVAAAIVLTAIFWPRTESRVYAIGGSQVELFSDGEFRAIDPKGIIRRGTFTESYADGVATITFHYGNGRTATGRIVEDVLTIPNAWVPVCGHRHSPDLPLQR